jgi:hypothetical protein
VSLTIISKAPRSRVRIGGEYDKDGARGFVLLEVSPRPALLTRKVARDVARALVRFAERVRDRNVVGSTRSVARPSRRKKTT